MLGSPWPYTAKLRYKEVGIKEKQDRLTSSSLSKLLPALHGSFEKSPTSKNKKRKEKGRKRSQERERDRETKREREIMERGRKRDRERERER